MEMVIPVETKVNVKVRDTKGKHAYVVAMCCGGETGNPEIYYTDYQLIRADSKDEARRAYNFLNDCTYYYGSVICQIE